MADKSEELNINVKSQEGTVICFKLRKTTQLKKMIESYCNRNGVSSILNYILFQYHAKSVRFVYEGERIKETDTPASVSLSLTLNIYFLLLPRKFLAWNGE